MLFLLVGIVLLVLKYMEYGAVATLDWWIVLSPFALAFAWWTWADYSGYTKRRVMAKQEAKRQARRERSKEALGIGKDGKR